MLLLTDCKVHTAKYLDHSVSSTDLNEIHTKKGSKYIIFKKLFKYDLKPIFVSIKNKKYYQRKIEHFLTIFGRF